MYHINKKDSIMKQLITAYRNWRIDLILLLAVIALLLASSESDTFLIRIAGVALAIADFRLARSWYREGKLKELDQIEE